ncbi:exopolysaccharide biosynthesis polyprenyl glycosylphosphotransferase [Methylobacterium sp. Leaf100]|uniref:exopolysaccharide biosynthesis polyprenyl glycosylphosphotransferase n=1 Tax=Methylobacterium sp. Leaf100 TaxID=1736252 RepID=UPI0006F2256B|nr:exopolysaccharide biosynthesis polyprenyl glycosylphosphotransferase [Methylobacterium sp. Leaf100]KQP18658.1 hypothetical protein ASF25_12535 [Methylobacterium sp. Leaf100]
MSAQAAATSQGIASLAQPWLLGAEQMGLPAAGEAIGLDRPVGTMVAIEAAILDSLPASAGQAALLDAGAGEACGLTLPRSPLDETDLALKRGFDLVVAALLVFLLAPLLVAVALLIRFTSEGPVLFRQTRGGLHGRPFEIYKFRTMTVQENGTAVVQARRGDPRVTPLGRFLRSSSLDELPQLLNVLKGDMSMIGPRPHAVDQERDFALRVADYALRHHVRPGITGWAQVCGYRGETRTEDALARRIALDLQYIERWSFWLDLWIMVRTCRAVLAPQNAY